MPNIEELLRKAMADGKFDNLPGKGKPLHLEAANPHADPDWELAYRMLKEAGYSLPWIETIREIERDIEIARKDLQIAWDCYGSKMSDPQAAIDATASWERSQSAFRNALTLLNQRIRDYNLQVPNPRFQRPVLDMEQELHKVTSGSS
jgi:DnaJ homolog subfamily C member 28